MKADRSVTIRDIPLVVDESADPFRCEPNAIRLSVEYQDGKSQRVYRAGLSRGYHMVISPLHIDHGITTAIVGSERYFLINEAGRFGSEAMQRAVEHVSAPTSRGRVDYLVSIVAKDNGLTIKWEGK